jgi:hypothetical protein
MRSEIGHREYLSKHTAQGLCPVSSSVSAPGAPPRLRKLPVPGASRARGQCLPCHARKPDQGEMVEGRHGAPLQEPHIRLSRAAHWARRPLRSRDR